MKRLFAIALICTSAAAFAQEQSGALPNAKVPKGRKAQDVFAKDNLVAWCIVPFDAKKRGPAERATMLKELGIRKVAYDWRQEHVASFEQEILEYKKNGLEYFAFWAEHDAAFELFKKYKLRPQIWRMMSTPKADSQEEKVAAAGRELMPTLKKVKGIGSKLGLYNHGGWSGQPENLIAVCKWLRENGGGDDVGIVYNLHHAHDRIKDFASVLKQMQPYLLCLNINGMNDNAEPKIVSVGKGQHDQRLLTVIRTSGYKGPIGILDHRPKMDAEQSLRENLEGLKKLNREFNKQRSGLKNQ